MSLPYFPMYPTDFEADTSHLTLEEDGAYNRLLRLMWMTPGCSLPDDNAWIKRRMRVDQQAFDSVVLVVIEEFFTRENGRLSNARLSEEFGKSNDAHSKRVSAGKRGGKAKALKTKETGSSNAQAMLKQCSSNQNQNQNHKEEESKASSSKEVGFYEKFISEHPKPIDNERTEDLFNQLVKNGTDPEQIVNAAANYAKSSKQFSDAKFIQRSDNFLDPSRGKWRDYVKGTDGPKADESEVLAFYAKVVLEKQRSAPVTVSSQMAARLLSAELVTPDQLQQAGVSQ